jgi:hypothetical protein
MTFVDSYGWGTIGKIPPTSKFFEGNLDISDIMDGTGLTMGYSKLVGEQVFKVTKPSETPFTARLTGKPTVAGAGWIERAVKRMSAGTTTTGSAKAGVMKRKVPQNVTADDDLRFYDSEGCEFVYDACNLKGWIPLSLPSDIDISDMFTNSASFGQLNSMLVDNVKQAYDMALEYEIQKYAVNLCPTYKETTETGKNLFTLLRDYVSMFKSDDYAFNQFAISGSTMAKDKPTFNTDYEHKSSDIVIFMNRIKYNTMMDDFASLYSPDYIKEIGAEVVLMDNAMPAPYATASAMSTDGFTSYGGLTPSTDMPMLGKSAPDILIMDRQYVEYRPVIDSYRVRITPNGAGDFTNEHLHFTGGINAKPWANAVAIKIKSA